MVLQILPQVRVFQEFNQLNVATIEPLYAFITGPHYNVRSYAKGAEDITVGPYDPVNGNDYPFPGQEPGEVVDAEYTEVYMNDTTIRYYEADAGADGFNPVAPNRLELGGIYGWADNDVATRIPGLVKDVEVGDLVTLTNPGDLSDTITSRVRQVIPEIVPSSTDPDTTADGSNAGTPASPGSWSPISAPGGSNWTLDVDPAVYRGWVGGLITEQYTLSVTTSGVAGVARMSVTSSSGKDDAIDVLIPTSGKVEVTPFGLSLDFSGGSTNFTVGEQWQLQVVAAFTATDGADIAVSGTFTGAQDATYIVEVVRGGTVDDDAPLVNVTTNTGVDNGGPFEASSTATPFGARGLSLTFTASAVLCQGDRFLFDATAAAAGRASVLILSNTLPATLTALNDVNIKVDAVRDDTLITQIRFASPGVENWTQDLVSVNLTSGITYFLEGDPMNGKPIISGQVALSYRALVTESASVIDEISDVSLLPTKFSDLTPENPLGYAIKKALENSNGVAVKFAAVPSNDLAGYLNVLERTLEREDLYSFVPLTQDRAILNAFAAHVEAQSSPAQGRWRITWVSEPVPTEISIIEDGGDPTLATFTQFPDDPAGQYRLVESDNAQFLTDGVQVGDQIRYNFATDSFGNSVFETDTVFLVISENQLLVQVGPSSPINTAIKVEVWRQLDNNEVASVLASLNTYSSRRVYNVFGGEGTADGFQNLSDFYLASSFAGLRSGVLAHQGLTNVELAGWEDIPYTTRVLSGADLDLLANAGYWLAVQNTNGEIYSRKQISTDLTDINTVEQSVTTNVDQQSYTYKNLLAPYIGRANNVESVRDLIVSDLEGGIAVYRNNASLTLGPQVLDGSGVTEIRPSTVSPDRLIVRMDLIIPYPLNSIDLFLEI